MQFNFLPYLKNELAVLPAVLYVLGLMLRQASFIKNKNIPLVLGVVGVAVAFLWAMATSEILNWHCFFYASFAAVTQGVLSAGAAVYVHQLLKQQNKDE